MPDGCSLYSYNLLLPVPSYSLCPEPACRNAKKLGGGRSASHRTWGSQAQAVAEPGSEGRLLHPPSVCAGTAAARRRDLNACAVAGSHLVLTNRTVWLKTVYFLHV